ncbi:MAG: HD domain-containing protein, partial [Oscillospiraceae bacterium]|nr:HD domain-containing protein [Oscillospiraceae bacterium]
EIFSNNIKRENADTLLNYLKTKSDFFKSPSSAYYHASYEGGLCEHSLNVYDCLRDYLNRERTKKLYNMNYSDETVALVALLHDVCKADTYKVYMRNVKNEDTGIWEKVPSYKIDDKLPYGHGEKSVYIISGFMKLSREEAFAIRWHMGFSGLEDKRTIGDALKNFPLAFALSVADMEATYYLE